MVKNILQFYAKITFIFPFSSKLIIADFQENLQEDQERRHCKRSKIINGIKRKEKDIQCLWLFQITAMNEKYFCLYVFCKTDKKRSKPYRNKGNASKQTLNILYVTSSLICFTVEFLYIKSFYMNKFTCKYLYFNFKREENQMPK